jgi:hypothetical protein
MGRQSKAVGSLAALALAMFLSLVGSSSAAADIYTVNNTGDQSDADVADTPNVCDVTSDATRQCTLRAAMEEANFTAGPDTVDFSVPGENPHTIAPATPLPELTGRTTINGYSQPGTGPNTRPFGRPVDTSLGIVLDGAGVVNSTGIVFGFGASDSAVSGLVINRFPFSAIEIKGRNVTVSGNFLGTDVTGQLARPNGADGVSGFSGDALVGGFTAADRNVISSNGADGVGTNAPMQVLGNYIGVAGDARTPLGNGGDGIGLFSTLKSVIGAGGETSNVIAFNGRAGVMLINPSKGTRITQNRIYGNDLIGIDLDEDGVTANDKFDLDDGANSLQNYPVLRSARTQRGKTTVEARLNSEPNTRFIVEFFANRRHGSEGRRWIGAQVVDTDPGGHNAFTFEALEPVKAGNNITATATNPDGSTSEFSAPRRVDR